MTPRHALAPVLAGLCAVVVSAESHAGEAPRGAIREPLRAIARDYVASGDLKKALERLAASKASPADLLATLRSPAPLSAPGEPGERTVELKDGHGRTTDLLIVAPTTPQLAATTTGKKRLGLVVLLHGIKGKASQAQPIAKDVASTGEVVCIAPSAKPYPSGMGPEDGIPSFVASKFPHWWLYESDRSFVFEGIRTACAQYAIDPDRILLAGMSMGGYGTWNVGLRHADRFAGIAPLAGGLSRMSQFMNMKDERTWSLLENGRNFPVFAAHGDKDEVVPYGPDKEAADALKAFGGNVDFRTLEGVGHSVAGVFGTSAGGGVASDLYAFLRAKRRTSSPEHVVYVSISEKLDGAFWVRVAARPKEKTVRLEGKIDRAHNRIDVSAKDAERLRVYLDERVLDATKPVTVSVSGREVGTKKIAPDFTAILESWRSRQDERLVYPTFVEVDPREATKG